MKAPDDPLSAIIRAVVRDELARALGELHILAAERAESRLPPSDETTARTLLRPGEFGATIGVSRGTVYRLVKDGLPVVPVGATIRIEPGAALAWLQRNAPPEEPR